MGIIKSLIVFAVTTLILLAITIFAPSYNEVNKDSLNSILKTFKYQEGQTDFVDINNILDSIPADATVMYKDKIITSNIDRTSQDKRIAEGEKNLTNLTKSVQNGELTLNYKTGNELFKYIPYLIALLAGLFSALAVFFVTRKAEKEDNMLDYLRGEVQRLEMLNQGYEIKEREFNKKIEKNIPTNLDEAQRLLRTLLKEKEVMLVAIDDSKLNESKLAKTIERNKSTLAEAENKVKEVQTELSKLTRQDKLVEELKLRMEKYKNEIKENKAIITELEKNDPEKFERQIESLKNKLAELDQKYQESTGQVKELSKYDGLALTKQVKSLKEELEQMEEEAQEYQKMLESGTVAELVKEKQEKEEIKKELKNTKAQLEEALSNLGSTDEGKLKKDNMELIELNKELNQQIKQLRRDVQRHENSDSIKFDTVKNQLLEKNKENDDLKEELRLAQDKLSRMESSEPKSIIETDNSAAANYLELIKNLEHDIEKIKHNAERYQKERDEKIKSFEELNEAFKNTNYIIHRKDQEMSIMEEKIKELESVINVNR